MVASTAIRVLKVPLSQAPQQHLGLNQKEEETSKDRVSYGQESPRVWLLAGIALQVRKYSRGKECF